MIAPVACAWHAGAPVWQHREKDENERRAIVPSFSLRAGELPP
jgi:hypothetical protein